MKPDTSTSERLRRIRTENPGWSTEKNTRWKEKNPEKHAAHQAVKHAILTGVLSSQPCSRCGSTQLVHAHHDDYSQMLDVMWLCPIHHRERHRELKAS